MEKPATLKFTGFEVLKVVYEKVPLFTEGSFDVNVKHISHINKDDKNIIVCDFIVSIGNEDNTFSLQVQMVGYFNIEGELDETIYTNFTEISIPSIFYPYVRAFISSFVIQTGVKPIILQPINFIDKNTHKEG